jgi:hypothetical protein
MRSRNWAPFLYLSLSAYIDWGWDSCALCIIETAISKIDIRSHTLWSEHTLCGWPGRTRVRKQV